MRTLHLLAWGWLATAGLAWASEPQPPPPAAALQPPPKPTLPPGTPAEQVKTLIAQFDAASAEFRKHFEAAKTDEDQQKLMVLFPDANGYAAPLMQVAERHPEDPAAFDALLWIVQRGRPVIEGGVFRNDSPHAKAKATLVRDYLTDPRVGPITRTLGDEFDPQSVGILRNLLAKNPNKAVQARAAFALAKLLDQRAAAVGFVTNAKPDQVAGLEKTYGREAVADVKRSDPAALRREYEDLLERILADKDYSATVTDRGDAKVTFGKLAERELFALRHLQPGKPALESEGEDIDGVKFKLSEYRGQVVLLIFSGHWCGPCRGLYPHERSLVEKFQGRPFAIIGVNSDATRDLVKNVREKEKLTWRMFWDGGSPDGPIANQWNVQGWPTLYLIDHNGIIVRQIGMEDELIEQKVKEAEAARKK